MAYEYRVIVQKHRTLLGGRFDATDLEALLNDEALEGWELDRVLDPELTALLEDGRDVHVILLRRARG